MTGVVREEAAAFEGSDYRAALVGTPFEGVRRFRTFGAAAPMYEITGIRGDRVHIVMFDNGEELDIPASEALARPQAD